jgi:Amt family ammonium transporter
MHAPHNVPLTLIGAGILWFGWFGFNAGSQLIADGTASLAFVNTLAAGVGGLIAWTVYEKLAHGKPTAVGAASGAISGMVAITPSCAFLMPLWALVLGLVVGLVCGLAVNWKFFLGYDDSLDVVGIHLVGGIVGTLYIGLLGQVGTTPVCLFFTGDFSQLGKQAIGVLVVGIYAFSFSYLLGWIIQKTIGFRVKSVDEIAGLDVVIHGETAYSQADPRWSRNP